MEFLLNLGTRTIHNSVSKDKRCRIALMEEGNKKVFTSYKKLKTTYHRAKECLLPVHFAWG